LGIQRNKRIKPAMMQLRRKYRFRQGAGSGFSAKSDILNNDF